MSVKMTDMSFMFDGASSFNQYIGDWDVSNVYSMVEMFKNTNLSTTNYDYILYNWSLINKLQPDVDCRRGRHPGIALPAQLSRQQLIDEFGWTIDDGGPL